MPNPTRRDAVIADIQRRIATRMLMAGDKLPSIRAAAQKFDLSPTTVADAYDRLVADGSITARRGAGFFVADKPQAFSVSETGPQLAREVDPLWVARQSIDSDPALEKPGCGWLPSGWMPLTSLRKSLRAVTAAPEALLTDYAPARGHAGLRRLVSSRLLDQGLSAPPNQNILLTGSGSQALDLICRLILRPGDTVVLDDPCYFNFQALMRAHQIRFVSVAYTRDGPDLAAFEQVLRTHRPRLYLTNSALHNPTGATITAPVAHRVLSLAAAHDVLIVEDDIFSEFEPDMSPRLATLDGLDRVLRVGSFTKTLSASLRCGYIAARADWVEALIDLQVASQFSGPSPMIAEVLHRALTDGSYRKHMQALQHRLSQGRRAAMQNLESLGLHIWVKPRGGFYLWCQLPKGIDAAKLARLALEQNLVLAPGNVFSPSQSKPHHMRFNVSQMADASLYDRLQDLMKKVS
ncbi:PLP-dependent aminotransferase family protein [Cognatishimia sp. SS12]|uniref:aminotransferase-like domain-containing protein n=1 Tax=Cognatishimia sp. SS12 TaxID=2979465 RepID=UPI00232F013D|nr:PLP-dependent aminotransferase family protein [Cognatishimia sp. SS12]MDC0737123.1 PLP-dependent aminotransferase family protein [Cognatishimia sp. SS12]